MVTRSIDNWEKHKEDVFNIIKEKYKEKRANKFINFYADRYNKYNRSFIHYKLAFWLTDDYHYVNRVGTRWYACVGTGGTGKTTFFKNIFSFLDPTFNLKRITFNVRGFVKNLNSFETVHSMKACFMDEPDDSIYTTSQQGKKLREILGKMRQQNLFLGICATDLKDIPPYIFRKLDGIFFTPCLGKYMFFKNRPRAGAYILQRIREDYSRKGYKVFFELKKSVGCLTGDTQVATPLTEIEEKKYLKDKASDYKQSIHKFLTISQKGEGKPEISERDQIIAKLRKKGMMPHELSQYMGLSTRRIHQILGNGGSEG